MHIVRAACAALALTCSTAGAADWYAEFHVGTTRADLDDPVYSGTARVEGAYGVGAGLALRGWLGLQLDWHTLGENPPAAPCAPSPCATLTPTYPEHAWVLRAMPRFALAERFTVELGLGVARWEGDADGLATSGTDPLCSLGVEWRFAGRWSATVEHQELALDGARFGWSGAALRYRF
jgi:opacity protein-like surface antigen